MSLGTEVGLGLRDCVKWGDPAPPWKGAQQPPLFGPFYRGETVAHLNYGWALVNNWSRLAEFTHCDFDTRFVFDRPSFLTLLQARCHSCRPASSIELRSTGGNWRHRGKSVAGRRRFLVHPVTRDEGTHRSAAQLTSDARQYQAKRIPDKRYPACML